MTRDDRLAGALRRALAHVGERLAVPAAVVLWDGSRVPLGPGQALLTLTIRSPGVVASLLRRPRPENLLRHYAVGNLAVDCDDLVGFGLATRGSARKQDLRRIDKLLLLRLLWRFLLVAPEHPGEARRYAGTEVRTGGGNAANQDYIAFHYDAGNDFYRLFLDPEMLYSCAYFRDWDNDLATAQRDKLDLICRKLRLQPGERLLDVGCGWGGLICHAAQHYGVSAHGITLSVEQKALAEGKIRQLGLQDRVSVELRDYRDLDGSYDKIASIGMFEHVGVANFPAYFRKLNSLLSERGLLLNHAIARRAKTERGRHRLTPEKSLLLKYIFPGSELAPIGDTVSAMEAHGFELHDVEALREHYALTCRHWYASLQANRVAAEALVGPERSRLWLLYLAGVSLGFQAGSMLIFQALASRRAKAKGPSGLPPTRADIYRPD